MESLRDFENGVRPAGSVAALNHWIQDLIPPGFGAFGQGFANPGYRKGVVQGQIASDAFRRNFHARFKGVIASRATKLPNQAVKTTFLNSIGYFRYQARFMPLPELMNKELPKQLWIIAAMIVLASLAPVRGSEFIITDPIPLTGLRQSSTNTLTPGRVTAKSDGTNFVLFYEESMPTNVFATRITERGDLVNGAGFLVAGTNGVWNGSSIARADDTWGFFIRTNSFEAGGGLSMILFNQSLDPFFMDSARISTNRTAFSDLVLSGNPHGFMAFWRQGESLQFSTIGQNGVPGRIYDLGIGTPLHAVGSENGHLILAQQGGVRAAVFDNAGKIVIPGGVLLSFGALSQGGAGRPYPIAAMANSHGYLVAFSENLFLLDFQGQVIATNSFHLPAFISSISMGATDQEWWIVHQGNDANSVNRTKVELISTELRCATASLTVPSTISALAINERGVILAASVDQNGTQLNYRLISLDGLTTATGIVPRTTLHRFPILSGGNQDLAIFYQKSGGLLQKTSDSIAVRVYEPNLEFKGEIAFTNVLEKAHHVRAAGSLGTIHLFAYSGGTIPSYTLTWLLDTSVEVGRNNPKLVSRITSRASDLQIIPGTNEFFLFQTAGLSTECYRIGADGSASTAQIRLPVAKFAGSGGEPIWAVYKNENNQPVRAQFLGTHLGPARTIPPQLNLRTNAQIAAIGKHFLMTWEEHTSTGIVLRAGHFMHGDMNVSQTSVLRIYPTNTYSITSSLEGFLIVGTDGIGAPDTYPHQRQYYVYLDQLGQPIHTYVKPADGQVLDQPRPLGLTKDFLVAHTRSSPGIDVAGQFIMVASTDFRVQISEAETGINLSATGEADREYLLESTTDFRSWMPIETIQPGDIKRMPRKQAEFYRLMLTPN